MESDGVAAAFGDGEGSMIPRRKPPWGKEAEKEVTAAGTRGRVINLSVKKFERERGAQERNTDVSINITRFLNFSRLSFQATSSEHYLPLCC